MKSKKNILLVVNPVSGDIDKSEMTSEIRKKAEVKKIEIVVYETTGKDDKEKLKELIVKEDPIRILVAGGDGTINMVAAVLRGFKEIPMGVLAAGSANGLAMSFGISGTTAEQLETALGDCIMEIDILELNDHLSVHISDLGMNAELIRNYESSNLRGKLGYVLQSLPTVLKCEYPFDFTIKTTGEELKRQGILLAVANASKFGTGVNINPEGIINDGKFEIVIFKQLDLLEMFKAIGGEIDLESEFVEVISTSKAVISTGVPVAFQTDGQFQGEVTEVTAKLCPEKIKVAVPEDFKKEQIGKLDSGKSKAND